MRHIFASPYKASSRPSRLKKVQGKKKRVKADDAATYQESFEEETKAPTIAEATGTTDLLSQKEEDVIF